MNRDSLVIAVSRFIDVCKRLSDETTLAEDRRIYEMYLVQASLILAKIGRSEEFQDDIKSMDRLFGHSWPKNGEAHTEVYASWDEFRVLVTGSIRGMTVNERLYTLDLSDCFDKAVAEKGESALGAVLSKLLLSETSIHAIIAQKLGGNG